MDANEVKALQDKCREIRYLTMEAIGHLGIGHMGGSMSIVETLVVLYYRHMNIDPKNPKMEGRDRLILSKGHAGPTLYSILADKGYFDKKLLLTLNQGGTMLPSHADMNRTPGIDMTTGSLGQGFSCAMGIALGSQIRKDNATIYTVIGDGESQEGLIWEAAMFAAHKKLENLIAFTDFNKMQIDGMVKDVNDIEPLPEKWRAFGWNVYEVDGHNVEEIDCVVKLAKHRNGKPTMVILSTFKGKGVTFLEENWKYNHNIPISKEQTAAALAELKGE